MKEIGDNMLKREGIAPESMKFSYACDLRYEAQFNETEVPAPISDGSFTLKELPLLLKAFDQRHDILYGFSLPGSTLELLCLRLVAEGITKGLQLSEMPYVGEDASSAVKAQRKICHNGEFLMVPIYDGSQLGNGHKISGPAIVEEPNTTLFLTADYELVCDKYSNYLMYPRGKSLEEVIKALRK